MRLIASVFASAALCEGGCAQLLNLPENVQLAEPGPWSCLGSQLSPIVSTQTSAAVQVRACDFVNNCETTVSGLSARICAKRDVGCTNPLSETFEDADGLFDFEVPTGVSGFDGYLEVTSRRELCTNEKVFGSASPTACAFADNCDPESGGESCEVPVYARSMLFFNPPIVSDPAQAIALPLLSTVALPAVVEAAGAAIDPTAGNLFITALDCDGLPAPGVTYGIGQNQQDVTQLYVDSGVVSDTVLQTDASGIGGFVGVPPGFAEVTGYNSDLETVGKIGVQVAPLTMTYSALVPSP